MASENPAFDGFAVMTFLTAATSRVNWVLFDYLANGTTPTELFDNTVVVGAYLGAIFFFANRLQGEKQPMGLGTTFGAVLLGIGIDGITRGDPNGILFATMSLIVAGTDFISQNNFPQV